MNSFILKCNVIENRNKKPPHKTRRSFFLKSKELAFVMDLILRKELPGEVNLTNFLPRLGGKDCEEKETHLTFS